MSYDDAEAIIATADGPPQIGVGALGRAPLNPIPKGMRFGEGSGGGPGSPDTSTYSMAFVSFASSPASSIGHPDRGGFHSFGDFTKQGMRAACQAILDEARNPTGKKPLGWPDAPYPLPPGWCVAVHATWFDCHECMSGIAAGLGGAGVELLAAYTALTAGAGVLVAAGVTVIAGVLAVFGFLQGEYATYTLVSQYACSNAKSAHPIPQAELQAWARRGRSANLSPTRTAQLTPPRMAPAPLPTQYARTLFGVPEDADAQIVAGDLGAPPSFVSDSLGLIVRGGGFGHRATGRFWGWGGGPWRFPWAQPQQLWPVRLYDVPREPVGDTADFWVGHAVMRVASGDVDQSYLDRLSDRLERDHHFPQADVVRNLLRSCPGLAGSARRYQTTTASL